MGNKLPLSHPRVWTNDIEMFLIHHPSKEQQHEIDGRERCNCQAIHQHEMFELSVPRLTREEALQPGWLGEAVQQVISEYNRFPEKFYGESETTPIKRPIVQGREHG